MNPPTNATPLTTIEDLPPELINELFRHLHPRDLVICSMVNKRWHSIYTDFRSVDSLIELCPFGHLAHRWYHSDRRIEEKELCDWKLLLRLLDRPLLLNLKRLAICAELPEFDLNKLNLFQQLVHLQIGESDCVAYFAPNEVVLNLPKLEVLDLQISGELPSLVVDCPVLSVFVYEGFHEEMFDLKHPETIRKLRGWMDGSKLAPFENVEYLDTLSFEAISRDTLQRLPKLKELRYVLSLGCSFLYGHEVGTLDKEKLALRQFLDDVEMLRGSDFKFSYAGFPLTKTMLDQIDFGVRINKEGKEVMAVEYIYTKNYHLFECLDFEGFIDYNFLLYIFSGQLPSCFFRKFTSICWLRAEGPVADADHLLWFLKSLGSVRRLQLTCTGLGQEFFDQLPVSARRLNKLEVYEDNGNPQMDFNFVAEFPYLVSCWLSQRNLSIESLTALVRLTFGKLSRGLFQFGSEYQHAIGKGPRTQWWTIRNDNCSSQTVRDDPELIVEWLEMIRKSEDSPANCQTKISRLFDVLLGWGRKRRFCKE